MLAKIVNDYSSIEERFSMEKKKRVKRWILGIPGAGCEYRKKTGGCSMCGFHVATNMYSKGFLLPALIFKFMYFLAERFYDPNQPSELSVYNGGSFWNDNEIPVKFQKWFFEKVSSHKTIEKVLIENRCEYITQEKISEAVNFLGPKKLYVGIGFESANDHIRNNIIRKGVSRKSFEKKVKLLNDNGACAMAYVFLKPLGINDQLALKDVLNTIEYALSVGVREIDVSCAFVQRDTEMEKQYLKGNFLPPRLDIVIEVIKEIIRNNWPVTIGGFGDYPPPIAIPRNCDLCSDSFYDLIEIFRRDRILGKIPTCNCM